LRGASRLVHYAFGFCFYVTRGATDAFLHFSADVAGLFLPNDSHP
jgi:hypothetical protein